MVATTAPLLQTWFARTGHPSGKDPYFLYGASNLGSMLALLGYPLLMEPNLRLAQQSGFWAIGYGLLAALTLACTVIVWRASGGPARTIDGPAVDVATTHPEIGRRLSWIGLALVPSSLLLGVTTYLSTDVASIPLFWVIPLALYLLTYVLAFTKREVLPPSWMARAMPMLVILLVLVTNLRLTQLIWIPLHLLTFFVTAMVCHGELARRRPSVRYLTEFYLAISFGGVLGGLFNALIAPVVFDRVVEYPLAMVLACLALPTIHPSLKGFRTRALDLSIPVALGVMVYALLVLGLGPDGTPIVIVLIVVNTLGVFACYTFKDRPVRFALGVAALLANGILMGDGQVLHRERSFFGVIRIRRVEPGPYHQLFHGSTLHGQQSLDPNRRWEPLSYFHRTGPIGQVFDVLRNRPFRPSVAVVGLGTGSLAAYAEPGQHWTFYEIDPAVVRISRNPLYFTYLRDCRASALEIVLGDARLRLRNAPEHGYDLIVLDAFSSDAIPIHLLTREAVGLYRSKLASEGMIAFHISNRYLDLAPVVGALACNEGFVCLIRNDLKLSPDELHAGKQPSIWVVMANREADLGTLGKNPTWLPPKIRPSAPMWTDDFSNVIEYFIFR